MAKTIQPLEPTMPVDSDIQDLIYVVRGQQVMLDRDLATLYGVETKVLNQAVKRNINRFPDDFMFQLTPEECLRSQIVTSNNRRRGGTRYMPYVFTENGRPCSPCSTREPPKCKSPSTRSKSLANSNSTSTATTPNILL